MSEDSSSFKKWVGGVLATVIGGFLLWWLTGPLSPFKSTEPTVPNSEKIQVKDANSRNIPQTRGPDVVITLFELKRVIMQSDLISAVFEVYNQGNETATECKIYWEIPVDHGNYFSQSFSLTPGARTSITIPMRHTIQQLGDYNTKAYVSCNNGKSMIIERPLKITENPKDAIIQKYGD